MKRLFILGASVLQLPAIQKAKEMGLYVAVADYDIQAVGIPYADEFYNISTIDEEGIYQIAKKFKADGIMTLATDMPMKSVAYATHKLGLAGISSDTAAKATDKGKMIKAFELAGVEHPWYIILSTPEELKKVINKVTYPCISKPVDNAGSRGVILTNSREELEKAVQYSFSYVREGGVIIEEYLEGNEVSVEIIVIDGDIHILQVTDKITTGAPYFVEMGHSQPSGLGYKNRSSIKSLAIRAVKSIGIDNGSAHVEIMLTKKGPKMIEIGARMGGDCITTHLVPFSTGIDMVKAVIEIALGEKPDVTPKFDKGSAIRYFKEEIGIIKEVSGVEEAMKVEGVRQITLMKNVGDDVGKIGSSVDRIGYVISQAEDVRKAVQCCENAMSVIKFSVEKCIDSSGEHNNGNR